MLRKIILALLVFIPTAVLAQPASYIYRSTPVANSCLTGRSCSGLLSPLSEVYINSLGTPIPVSIPSASLKETTPLPMVIVAANAVPTAFGTPNFVGTPGIRTSSVTNTTNQDLYCALNGSITPFAFVPAGSTWYENWAANQLKLSGGINCIHPSSTPASGSVYYKAAN